MMEMNPDWLHNANLNMSAVLIHFEIIRENIQETHLQVLSIRELGAPICSNPLQTYHFTSP